MTNFTIFCGSSHKELGNLICSRLNCSSGKIKIEKSENLDISLEICEAIRKKHVYIIQTACFPTNDNIMEMCQIISACKSASCYRVVVVAPLLPYSKQDKSNTNYSPITAKLVADFIVKAGADELITMNLHTPQIQGFYDIPVENLCPEQIMIDWLKKNVVDYKSSVLVSPDISGTKRVSSMADKLDIDFAIVHKGRKMANNVSKMILVGNIINKTAIIIDDMAETFKTIFQATKLLKDNGAKKVYAIVTHGILTADAFAKINECQIETLAITNTVPQKFELCSKIKVIDVSNIFSEAIRRNLHGEPPLPFCSS